MPCGQPVEDGRMRPPGWSTPGQAVVIPHLSAEPPRGLPEQTSSSHHGYGDVLQMERKSLQPRFTQEPQKYSCGQGGTATWAEEPGAPDCLSAAVLPCPGELRAPRNSGGVFHPYGEPVREPKRQPLRLPLQESGRVQSRNATSSLD